MIGKNIIFGSFNALYGIELSERFVEKNIFEINIISGPSLSQDIIAFPHSSSICPLTFRREWTTDFRSNV